MKYQTYPAVTTHQVGGTVYVVENDIPVEAVIQETESRGVYSGSGSTSNVNVFYKLVGYSEKWFPEAEIFANVAAMKTYFNNLADGL